MLFPYLATISFILLHFAKRVSCVVNVTDCFILHSHQYLEKSGTVFIPEAKNITACLQRCLVAEFERGFICESVMWKKNIDGCILSRWNIRDRISFLRGSSRVMVDLYENKCITKLKPTTSAPLKTRPTTVYPVLNKVSAFHLNGLVVDGESQKDPVLHNRFPPPKAFQERNLDVMLAASLDELSGIKWTDPSVRKQQIIRRHNHPDGEVVESRMHREIPRELVPPHMPEKQLENKRIETDADRHPKAPCFVRMKGKMLENFVEKVLRSNSATECLVKCLQSEQFYCASVNYNANSKVCSLNGGNRIINKVSLKDSDFDYYENTCSSHNTAQENKDHRIPTGMHSCFEMRRNTVYVSFEGQIELNIRSEDECKAECMKTSDMNCVAVNWFAQTKQCLLFDKVKENELTTSMNSVFYWNKCANKHKVSSHGGSSNDYYDTTN